MSLIVDDYLYVVPKGTIKNALLIFYQHLIPKRDFFLGTTMNLMVK